MAEKRKYRGLWWLLGLTTVASFGVGGYALYQYFRIQKINATVTSPQDAINIIKTVNNG